MERNLDTNPDTKLSTCNLSCLQDVLGEMVAQNLWEQPTNVCFNNETHVFEKKPTPNTA